MALTSIESDFSASSQLTQFLPKHWWYHIFFSFVPDATQASTMSDITHQSVRRFNRWKYHQLPLHSFSSCVIQLTLKTHGWQNIIIVTPCDSFRVGQNILTCKVSAALFRSDTPSSACLIRSINFFVKRPGLPRHTVRNPVSTWHYYAALFRHSRT